jgi:PqqD family protein of HPr-rel-A system
MAGTEVWRAGNLLMKSWDDGVIVYNLASGTTHLLNPTAGQVLYYLTDTHASVAALSRRLASQNDLESDQELDHIIEDLLKQMDSLGLVEPVTE